MTLKLVQVGMGVRGAQWARVIREDARTENVAYVRQHLGRAYQTLQDWGEPKVPCFATLEEGLEKVEADAVVLVTPPEVHHQQVTAALQKGCHVLCEKPLSEIFGESVDMVRQADETGRLLMVGHNFRYLSSSQTLRRMLTEQVLGAAGYGHFVYLRNRDGRRADLNKYPLTMKQPMLLEQSVHHLDLMRYCYQDEVETVAADTWRPDWSVYKDHCCASALLRFRSGLHVNYIGTWTSGWNRFCFEWRTDCAEGVFVQKQQFSDLYTAHLTPGLANEGVLFKTGEDVETLQPVALEPDEAFVDDTRRMLSEFVEAIQDGKKLVTSGKDHLKTLGLTLACVEASETGGWVEMDDFYRRQGVPAEWL
jgi:predicted dehydrogenase